MKFLSLAVAALVGMTEARKNISADQMKSRIQKGQFNKETLMRGAKPYGAATARMLEQDQEFEINGLYSVAFSSCVSMTVQDEDLLADGYITYAQNGQLVAEKSYIIFTACKSSDCYYQSDDQKMTFITDIATFFQSFADFLPNQVESYCEGCNQNYDYCMGNLDAQYAQGDDGAAAAEDAQGEQDQQDAEQQDAEQEGEQQDQQEQQDQADQQEQGQEGEQEGEQAEQGQEGEQNGGRKLRNLSKVTELPFRRLANNQVVQMIDCDMCNAYECFAEENNQQQEGDDVTYEFEDAMEWLDALSGCQQMQDATYNDLALYAGLICNADGTGVEIGVFMDQDCTLYAPKLSFGNLMSASDSQYYSMSEEVVEYMFTNDFSCYQPDIQYTNPYEYQEQEAEQNQDENANEEYPEAAEWCQNLYNGEMQTVSLSDCGMDQNAEQNNQEQEYDDNLDTYGWYSYQLSQNQAEDATEVCKVIQGWDTKQTHTVYDKTSGGTLYTYKKNKGQNSKKSGMRPGGVAALVIFIVLVAAGVAAFVMKNKKKGDKRAPLISSTDGTMA